MKRRGIIAAGLGVALFSGALFPYGRPPAAQAASLASLALQRSDLPAGYKQTNAQNETIQQEAKDSNAPVATLHAQGWQGTYSITFQKNSKTTATEIDSGVDRFKGASGAKWDLTHGIQQLKKQIPGATTVSVSGIGAKAVGIKYGGKSGKTPLSLLFIVFVRGSYLGGVGLSVAGTTARPSLAEVARYAKLVDGRIKNA